MNWTPRAWAEERSPALEQWGGEIFGEARHASCPIEKRRWPFLQDFRSNPLPLPPLTKCYSDWLLTLGCISHFTMYLISMLSCKSPQKMPIRKTGHGAYPVYRWGSEVEKGRGIHPEFPSADVSVLNWIPEHLPPERDLTRAWLSGKTLLFPSFLLSCSQHNWPHASLGQFTKLWSPPWGSKWD
jgi:hypothetical protein